MDPEAPMFRIVTGVVASLLLAGGAAAAPSVTHQCLGIDDTAALQADIDANAMVVIAPGTTCSITLGGGSHGLIIHKSHFELRVEHGATLRLADGQVSGLDRAYMIQIGDGFSDPTDVRITGPGTLDGNRANNPLAGFGHMTYRALLYVRGAASHVEISDLRLVDSTGDAVLIDGRTAANTEYVRVHDNVLYRNEEGINFRHADFVSVRDNQIFETTKQDGIEPNIGSDDWVVASNLIEQTDIQLGAGVNTYQRGRGHGVIANNVIRGHADGIDVDGSSHVTVVGNVLDKEGATKGRGIIVRNTTPGPTQSVIVTSNTIHGYVTGIRIEQDDVAVRANTIAEPRDVGISSTGSHVEISGNHVLGPDVSGIEIGAGRDVTLTLNEISDPDSSMQNAIQIGIDAQDVRVETNDLAGFSGAAVVDLAAGGSVRYARNVGFRTEGRGTTTVGAVDTVSVVAHGLDVTPQLQDIRLTPVGDPGAASRHWVSNVGPDTFELHLDTPPGGAGAVFGWSIDSE
jgi:hypothetical protein